MDGPSRQEGALQLSYEDLSRIMGEDADVRSSAGRLDTWHWGSLHPGRRAAGRGERRHSGARREASPGGRAGFGRQSAVVQSSAYLPQSETPGISPGRGLGDSIATSPLSATLRRARQLTLTAQSPAHRPSRMGWASPGEGHTVGSRASFASIMRKREGHNLSELLPEVAQRLTMTTEPASPAEAAGAAESPAQAAAAVSEHPVSLRSSPGSPSAAETPAGPAEEPSARSWTWSWAWTSPALPPTPGELARRQAEAQPPEPASHEAVGGGAERAAPGAEPSSKAQRPAAVRAASVAGSQRASLDLPSLKDGMAPTPKAVRFSLDAPGGLRGPPPRSPPLRQSAELRQADVARGRSLSMGGSSAASPPPQAASRAGSAQRPAAAASPAASSGRRADGARQRSPWPVAEEDRPLSSHRSPHRAAAGSRRSGGQPDPVRALWDSCRRAADAARSGSLADISGRSVRCSLLASMDSAASRRSATGSSPDDAQQAHQPPGSSAQQVDQPLGSESGAAESGVEADAAPAPAPRAPSSLQEQLARALRERRAAQAQSSQPQLRAGSGSPAAGSEASSIASCGRSQADSGSPASPAPARAWSRFRETADSRQTAESRQQRASSPRSLPGQQLGLPPEPTVDASASLTGRGSLRSPSFSTEWAAADSRAASGLEASGVGAASSDDDEVWTKQQHSPINEQDWTRQRLWWRARLRASEAEAQRLRRRLAQLEGGRQAGAAEAGDGGAQLAALQQQLDAKDWLLTQMQEEMQEAEEHFSRLLQDEHGRLEACEAEFQKAVREASTHLAEAALAEGHLLHELRETQADLEAALQEAAALRAQLQPHAALPSPVTPRC